MPKLRGLEVKRAKRKLARAGCTAGRAKKVRSRKLRRHRVLGTTPEAGTVVDATAPVRLRVVR